MMWSPTVKSLWCLLLPSLVSCLLISSMVFGAPGRSGMEFVQALSSLGTSVAPGKPGMIYHRMSLSLGTSATPGRSGVGYLHHY